MCCFVGLLLWYEVVVLLFIVGRVCRCYGCVVVLSCCNVVVMCCCVVDVVLMLC